MRARYLTVALVLAAAVARGQTLTISPSQGYVIECGETFVTLTGTNLVGTASTLVDFASGSTVYELPPNVATPSSLQVWIPLEVTYAVGTLSLIHI